MDSIETTKAILIHLESLSRFQQLLSHVLVHVLMPFRADILLDHHLAANATEVVALGLWVFNDVGP